MHENSQNGDHSQNHKCPYCGANVKSRKERLSKGLVQSLIKFKAAVIALNRNKIHLQDDLALSNSEFTNFQKLRYHGMCVKYVNPETKQNEAGYWLLTKRGNEFVKNTIEVPASVTVFRNKIVSKSDDRKYANEILRDYTFPVWDEKDDFIYSDIQDIEEVKFDVNGQGLLFN